MEGVPGACGHAGGRSDCVRGNPVGVHSLSGQ